MDDTQPNSKPRTSIPEGMVEWKRDRPHLASRERPRAGPKPKRSRKGWKTLFAVFAIAFGGLFFWRVFTEPTPPSYAAVCVDQRTELRQAAPDFCKDGEIPHYKWTYIGETETVPPVGEPVTAKSHTPSKDATILYGFAQDGGVFTAPERD